MAVRYHFTRDYDHRVNAYTDKAYRAGQELVIPNAHADGADAKGAGERVGDAKPDGAGGDEDPQG